MRLNLAMRLALVRQAVRRERPALTSLGLVAVGLAGALLGAWVVGWWCLGLVAIIESVGLIALGLFRDDAKPLIVRGARTVREVLADEQVRSP